MQPRRVLPGPIEARPYKGAVRDRGKGQRCDSRDIGLRVAFGDLSALLAVHSVHEGAPPGVWGSD